MNIYFGSNEYSIVPGTSVQEIDNKLIFQIIGDNINLSEFEELLQDKNNILQIEVTENDTSSCYYNYVRLNNLQKQYHVPYSYQIRNVVTTPEIIDPETGLIITPAKYKTVKHQLYADIIFVTLSKPELTDQVELNAANIEFIAIMSDIEL